MNRYLYPIYKLNIKSWIKYWLLKKKAGDFAYKVSEIYSGTFITISGTIKKNIPYLQLLGNSVQDGEPSPDNEVPIISCGDNVNLFDGEYRQGSESLLNSIYYLFSKNDLKLKVNTYAFTNSLPSSFAYAIMGCSTQYPNSATKEYNSGWKTGGTPLIFTFSEELYFGVLIKKADNSTITLDDISDYIYKLEEGSQATPYSPYNQGVITEKVVNKNIAKVEITNGYRRYQTGVIQSNVDYDGYIAVVKEQTNYICSKSSGNDTEISNLVFFDKNMTYISGVAFISNDKKFTTPANCKYVTLAVSHNITDFMIEQGSTATDYVEHQEQNYSIYTQQPMRSIEDVRDVFVKKSDGKWYERHNIARVLLNGTEDWTAAQQQENYYRFYTTKPTNASTAQPILCNIATFLVQYDTRDNSVYIGSTNMIFSRIIVNNEYITTDTAWKTYLANQYANGTPVYVDYILSTPNDILCTETQTTQLEELYNAKTYNGETNIYSEDIVNPYIEIQAYVKESE